MKKGNLTNNRTLTIPTIKTERLNHQVAKIKQNNFDKELEEFFRQYLQELDLILLEPNRRGNITRLKTAFSGIPSLLTALKEIKYLGLYELELTQLHAKLCILYQDSDIHFAYTSIDKDVLLSLKKVDLSIIKELSSDEIKSMRIMLLHRVIGGISDSKFSAAVKEKLSEHHRDRADDFARGMLSIYYQACEDRISKKHHTKRLEPVFWEYVGPEDSNNRDECVWALDKRFFTDDERKLFDNKYGFRLACRHTFMEITEETYQEAEKPLQDLTDIEIERRKEILMKFR